MSVFTDSQRLMQQLAKMANMDLAPIRRMVLVLDVDSVPTLYTESFLDSDRIGELPSVPLAVHADTPVTVSTEGGLRVETTNQHNERYRTYAPVGPESPEHRQARLNNEAGAVPGDD